jgi:hypothetical protein
MPSRNVAALLCILGLVSGLGMAVAAGLLIAPTDGPPPAIPFQDKIFHILVFGCLTGPGILVLPSRYHWFWLAHMAALGGGIELVQGRMNMGRSADPLDFLADLIGIGLAVVIGRFVRRMAISRT